MKNQNFVLLNAESRENYFKEILQHLKCLLTSPGLKHSSSSRAIIPT